MSAGDLHVYRTSQTPVSIFGNTYHNLSNKLKIVHVCPYTNLVKDS